MTICLFMIDRPGYPMIFDTGGANSGLVLLMLKAESVVEDDPVPPGERRGRDDALEEWKRHLRREHVEGVQTALASGFHGPRQ